LASITLVQISDLCRQVDRVLIRQANRHDATTAISKYFGTCAHTWRAHVLVLSPFLHDPHSLLTQALLIAIYCKTDAFFCCFNCRFAGYLRFWHRSCVTNLL
jgi:hypothetical protein